MMEQSFFKELLAQNIQSCSFAFNAINDENITNRLNESAASIGFIYRHIGETMHLFGFFFGWPSAVSNTTIGKSDEGQGNNLEESRELIQKGFALLAQIIDHNRESDWNELVETPFFGPVSKARLFSHILYHNAYHAGQIGLTLKRAFPLQDG